MDIRDIGYRQTGRVFCPRCATSDAFKAGEPIHADDGLGVFCDVCGESLEHQAINAYLAGLGWKRDVNYGGQLHYTSLDGELDVEVTRNCWVLGKFTDGDMETDVGLIAVGRYGTVEDGVGPATLQAAIEGLQ